jgi:hypothetical protein
MMGLTARISLAIAALATLAAPAAAQQTAAGADFTVTPVPPGDTRGKFIPPQGGVYVVDQKSGQIVICYPDIKEEKYIVICTPPAKIAQ